MEFLPEYLLKSSSWLICFALTYFLFLRNERYFLLNRIFLIIGALASVVFPLIKFSYTVKIAPAIIIQQPIGTITALTEASPVETTAHTNWELLITLAFLAGALFFLGRIFSQSHKFFRIIKHSGYRQEGNIKVVTTDAIKAPFSFFSYVFVNPSTSDNAKREIVKHEAEHIRQFHWIDLVLSELICILQWFNPFAWVYGHFVRQNHEYLADSKVIQTSENPAIYKAVLLNHLLGAEVIRIGHSFSYSLNKKRFSMMTNKPTPTIRKMKTLLILPMIIITFYAFAKPIYVYNQAEATPQVETNETHGKTVSGLVYNEDGSPLQGASIILRGTTLGTVADENGAFILSNVPEEGQIVISFMGMTSETVKPEFDSTMKITLKKKIEELDRVVVVGYGEMNPSAATSDVVEIRHNNSAETEALPLYILDGMEVSKAEVDKLKPDNIDHISVIKNNESIAKYGDKGKNGVIEIVTKKPAEKALFFVVEEMPEFPGGNEALMRYIATSITYPAAAMNNKIEGRVYVQFVIKENGLISDASIIRGVDVSLDEEALRVIRAMPPWKPGKQRNIPVNVSYTLPIDFVLQ
ncbi:M56 family metallopeptidase [Alkaliflexus imshenetskii]|uniref:M56 family metallopeptidase n=1 Tax=Alkaliflexus imshenetskii TaxID=286730 RepID=UPI0004BB3122|nr:M56 family metallopeptidase [Alkaliflexus imshenetskii]